MALDASVSGADKLVIRRVGLMLSGDLDNPILAADALSPSTDASPPWGS